MDPKNSLSRSWVGLNKFDVQAIPFLNEDGILRIPVVFESGGMEYEVTLKKAGKSNVFKVIEVSSFK